MTTGPHTDDENQRRAQLNAINNLADTPVDEIEYAAFVVTEARDTYDFLVRVVLIGGGSILGLLIAGGFLLWMVNNS